MPHRSLPTAKSIKATYDNQVVVYGLGAASSMPVRDIRRTVVFIYGQTQPGQDMFVGGGTKGGDPIRIRHRNWLNPHTNAYRWGDAYLDWNGGEVGQAVPLGGLGGGRLSIGPRVAQGQNQPYVCMAVTASRMRTISGCTTGCSMWIWTASRHLTTASATGGSS